jgi:hypothetical protein
VGYARELGSRGYAERAIEDHLRLIAELDRWMANEALLPVDLTPERLKQFVQAKRRAGHHRLSHRRFKQVLSYMRELESVPSSAEPAGTTAFESLLARYQRYLELTSLTVDDFGPADH